MPQVETWNQAEEHVTRTPEAHRLGYTNELRTMLLGVAKVQWTNDLDKEYLGGVETDVRVYSRKFNGRRTEPAERKALFAAMKEGGAMYRNHLEHSMIMVVSERHIDLATLTSEFNKEAQLVGFHDVEGEDVWAQLMDGLNRKGCIDEHLGPKREHLAEVKQYIERLTIGTKEYESAKDVEAMVEADIVESSQWLVRFYSYGECAMPFSSTPAYGVTEKIMASPNSTYLLHLLSSNRRFLTVDEKSHDALFNIVRALYRHPDPESFKDDVTLASQLTHLSAIYIAPEHKALRPLRQILSNVPVMRALMTLMPYSSYFFASSNGVKKWCAMDRLKVVAQYTDVVRGLYSVDLRYLTSNM